MSRDNDNDNPDALVPLDIISDAEIDKLLDKCAQFRGWHLSVTLVPVHHVIAIIRRLRAAESIYPDYLRCRQLADALTTEIVGAPTTQEPPPSIRETVDNIVRLQGYDFSTRRRQGPQRPQDDASGPVGGQ